IQEESSTLEMDPELDPTDGEEDIPVSDAVGTKPNDGLIPESSLSELLDRREDYHEFQNHLRKVEGAYQKILGQGNEVFKQLSGRRSSGLKSADLMVSSILQAIQHPKTAMSM
ncbi:MAG: hypothetical protein KC643_05460, partial [Nitrospira sp.]|nr:hypothetical protein [Nitrospira sp.]